jgi:hypothetical protein
MMKVYRPPDRFERPAETSPTLRLEWCVWFRATANRLAHLNLLPTCNENAPSRMMLCIVRTSHFYRAKFIPQLYVNRPTIVFTDSGNDVGSVQNGDWK